MIVHVWRRAAEAGIGRVVVAAGEAGVVEAIEAAGGEAVMTLDDHPSGSDRVFEAVERIDPDRDHDVVVNLQGDAPDIQDAELSAVLAPLADSAVDIATVAAEISDPAERDDPNVVKAAVSFAPGTRVGRALFFSRAAIPHGEGPLLHHIGLYAFRREALTRFVTLAPGALETRERLEQLRALEAGMRIDLHLIDRVPLEVNTPADLERARAVLVPDHD